MYFTDLFENFDQRILGYLNLEGVREVQYLSDIEKNTYKTNVTSVIDAGYIIKHDFASFMINVLRVNPSTANNIIYVLQSLGDFFQNSENNLKFTDDNSFYISKKINSHEGDIIQITHLKYDISFDITHYGVQFYDMTNYIKTSRVSIIDTEIDNAVNGALTLFNETLALAACVPTTAFDDLFFNQIKNKTFADIVNAKNQSPHFTYPNKNMIFEELKRVRATSKFSSHQANDLLMFNNKHAQLFLDTIKTMLSAEAYAHFLKAFNFFHNYQTVMNKKYIVSIDFAHQHTFQNVKNNLLLITFDNEFMVSVGLIDDNVENKTPRKKLFIVKNIVNSQKKDDVYLQTNDFAEFYDFVFDECSHHLTKMADKPVNEMVWGDLAVLMMANI